MRAQRQIERDILAMGKADGPELAALRRHLYIDGPIDRAKADFLVALHKRVQHRTPAFEQLYYQAIKDHLLADGWIDAEDAAWLRRMLHTDTTLGDGQRKFLHELKGEAKNRSREFELLFADCMNQPHEQHSCG